MENSNGYIPPESCKQYIDDLGRKMQFDPEAMVSRVLCHAGEGEGGIRFDVLLLQGLPD